MKKFTLVLFLLAGHFAHAQVPNGGFETWTDTITPANWATSNDPLSGLGVAPNVMQEMTSPGAGSSSIKLVTTAFNVGVPVSAAGAISSGTIEYANFTLEFAGGFPFTERPGQLTGVYKYTPVGTDSCAIWVLLTRWNGTSRDTVAYGSMWNNQAVGSWTDFGVTLNYMSTEDPDTALIVALSTKRIVVVGGVGGSTLWLDDMAFEFGASVEGINKVKSINAYPNPANDRLVIEAAADEYTEARVFDMTGRLVNTLAIENNGVNVSTLTNGNYVLEVTGRNGVARTAFSKQ